MLTFSFLSIQRNKWGKCYTRSFNPDDIMWSLKFNLSFWWIIFCKPSEILWKTKRVKRIRNVKRRHNTKIQSNMRWKQKLFVRNTLIWMNVRTFWNTKIKKMNLLLVDDFGEREFRKKIHSNYKSNKQL